MMKPLLYLALVFAGLALQAQNLSPYVVPNIDWIKYYSQKDLMNGAPTALDANSNVYSTGYTGTTSSADLIVLKYDSTGALVYNYPYDNGGYDNGKAIKVDGSGNAIIAGVSEDNGANTGRDIVVLKLSPSGSLLWSSATRFDGGVGGGHDEPSDVCVDANGDIYVTGKSQSTPGGDYNIITLKIDGNTGTVIWQVPFDLSGNDDVGTAMVLSSDGSSLFITGYATNASLNKDMITFVLKTTSGSPGWSPVYFDLGGDDVANAIILAGANIVVTGVIDNSVAGNGKDYLTSKYDGSTGAIIWQDPYDGFGSGGNDRATDLARDSTGNIGVVGTSENGGIIEYHTVLYDSTGSRYSVNKESTGLSTSFTDPQICNDTIAHHWYVSGEVMQATKDVLVYQITPSGNTSWRETIDGQNSDIDAATGVAVNGIGVVYVGALSKNSVSEFDYTTIKLNQTPAYLPVNYNFLTDTFSFSNLFYPNTGEILDTSHTTAQEVLYYTKFTYPAQYIQKDRISFVEFEEDTNSVFTGDSLNRVDMRFLEANTWAKPHGLNYQNTSSLSYFLPHTGAGGKTNVRGASHVMVPNIYPYVDLYYSSNMIGSKFYFVVKPGGRPESIFLKFDNASTTQLNATGDLEIKTPLGGWTLKKPEIYNVAFNFMTMALSTPTVTGTAGYTNPAPDMFKFATGTYNPAFPLIIEFDMGKPAATTSNSLNCMWSTYVGGPNHDLSMDINTDPANNVFVTGATASSNFPPAGLNVFQNSNMGSKDGFIDKYSAVGQRLWSTFVGGSEDDNVQSVTFAPNGDVYVAGITTSTNMATFGKAGAGVMNNLSPLGNPDGFLLQIDANAQTKKWLTLYGGNNEEDIFKCEFDGNGNLFLIGRTNSPNLPVIGTAPTFTNARYDACCTSDGFIAKINTASQLVWATYYGSGVSGTVTSVYDGLFDIDFTPNNDFYVVGYANGSNFPNVTNGNSTNFAHYPENNSDATIGHFTNSGQLKWSTCMGGKDPDNYYAVKVKNGKVYAVGYKSHQNFPLKNSGNWFYNAGAGNPDGVLSIWSTSNDSLLHSTYIVGNSNITCYDVDVDNSDVVYVAGQLLSTIFPAPLTQPANTFIEPYKGGNDDNFLYAIAPGDTNMVWATHVGGSGSELFLLGGGYISINNQNSLYLTGITVSNAQFPLFSGVPNVSYFDASWNSGVDVSITQFYLYPINLIDNIKENKNDIAQFSVYPNPTQSIINVKLKNTGERAIYYIYNTMGQLIKQGTMETDSYSVELSELPQGMYIMEVVQKQQKATVKFIKNG